MNTFKKLSQALAISGLVIGFGANTVLAMHAGLLDGPIEDIFEAKVAVEEPKHELTGLQTKLAQPLIDFAKAKTNALEKYQNEEAAANIEIKDALTKFKHNLRLEVVYYFSILMQHDNETQKVIAVCNDIIDGTLVKTEMAQFDFDKATQEIIKNEYETINTLVKNKESHDKGWVVSVNRLDKQALILSNLCSARQTANGAIEPCLVKELIATYAKLAKVFAKNMLTKQVAANNMLITLTNVTTIIQHNFIAKDDVETYNMIKDIVVEICKPAKETIQAEGALTPKGLDYDKFKALGATLAEIQEEIVRLNAEIEKGPASKAYDADTQLILDFQGVGLYAKLAGNCETKATRARADKEVKDITPEYATFKEEYKNDKVIALKNSTNRPQIYGLPKVALFSHDEKAKLFEVAKEEIKKLDEPNFDELAKQLFGDNTVTIITLKAEVLETK